jgi:lipid II:glycine glycyltransferase (peptidoglycan interpeptide bridge formation enzyme)
MIMIRTDFSRWDKELSTLPNPSILQTESWAKIKEQYGWSSIPLKWHDGDQKVKAMALVLKRQMRIGSFGLPISMLYVPKGPILDWENEELVTEVLDDIIRTGRQEKAFLVKIEPEVVQFTISNSKEPVNCILNPIVDPVFMESRGWQFSENQIQFRNSVFIDLKQSEEDLLAQMKQKTRYNIRLSERKGVLVREGTQQDFDWIYSMYKETSIRDGFLIRSKDYYLTVWDTFFESKQLVPLIALYEGEPLAALMLFMFHKTAYYIYGMSTDKHRNLMATYLLQWEAIRKAQSSGCELYDLWGAPNNLIEADPMWGVYRFKLGLGGTTVGTIGAWDYTLKPITHNIYTNIMPKFLNFLRRKDSNTTVEPT